MKRKKLQTWVGLPNILCNEFVVPELIQEAATPEAMAASILGSSPPANFAAVDIDICRSVHISALSLPISVAMLSFGAGLTESINATNKAWLDK